MGEKGETLSYLINRATLAVFFFFFFSKPQRLRKISKDKSIGAVVLRIDSGGGSAVASDSIAAAVQRVREVGTSKKSTDEWVWRVTALFPLPPGNIEGGGRQPQTVHSRYQPIEGGFDLIGILAADARRASSSDAENLRGSRKAAIFLLICSLDVPTCFTLI